MLKFKLPKDQFNTKARRAEGYGVHVTGYTGDVHLHGVEASYAYDKVAEVLTIDIKYKPFYIRTSAITEQITMAFGA